MENNIPAGGEGSSNVAPSGFQTVTSPNPASSSVLNQPNVGQAPTTLIDKVKEIRSLALAWESAILALKKNSDIATINNSDTLGEVIANIMLAYRHVEDARMRLGKVIQAMSGGVSVYDK